MQAYTIILLIIVIYRYASYMLTASPLTCHVYHNLFTHSPHAKLCSPLTPTPTSPPLCSLYTNGTISPLSAVSSCLHTHLTQPFVHYSCPPYHFLYTHKPCILFFFFLCFSRIPLASPICHLPTTSPRVKVNTHSHNYTSRHAISYYIVNDSNHFRMHFILLFHTSQFRIHHTITTFTPLKIRDTLSFTSLIFNSKLITFPYHYFNPMT